jgi:serine protease Do
MKVKIIKKTMIFLAFIMVMFSVSCSYFIPQSNSQIEQGTYSGEFYDYNEFAQLPIYVSNTYSLSDVDDYNAVLMNTKSHIIKGTIAIRTIISSGFSEDLITGSGFIFKEDENYYYAITNHHVIDTESNTTYANVDYEIKAYGDDGYHEASVIISNEDIDLAVIRFDKDHRENIELINITQRLGYRLKPHELVFAVGNPLRYYNNVSIGLYDSITLIENVDYIVIQHNAEIDEGSSGGALTDVDGNLLGVNTWGLDTGEISFAIPSFVVYNFLVSNDIIEPLN